MSNYPFAIGKKAVFFELDDVLIPSKDYQLQVYYLFSQFIEHIEQKSGAEMIEFMRNLYETEGDSRIFQKTADQFGLSDNYLQNFQMLHQNARLPLKLLLYQNMLDFMQQLVAQDAKIFIVTDGKPEQQLNKIRQTEWNGLEKYLRVFFVEELNLSKAEIFQNLLDVNELSVDEALVVGANKFDAQQSKLINLPYIESLKIYK